MVIVVPIPMAWRHVRTEGTFTAHDPWAGRMATPFSLESYVSVPAWKKKAGVYAKIKNPPLLTLKCGVDGNQRPIAASLVELYRAREIRADQIPGLLHELEPQLQMKKGDYESLRNAPLAWAILVGVFLAIAAICYAVYWTDSRNGTAGPASAEDWLHIALGYGGLAVLIGGVAAVKVLPVMRRQHRQIAWVRERNSKVGVGPER